ncbi:MAG: CCA tRNA nucleotidyltransferase [Gemmatimonadaceae bacterium]|nr:CCA tRNA nucleotidyltransferase [Gemmatimonadaceae bacterium]
MTRLAPPPEILRLARTLHESGFEAWLVGGAVRDAFLGHDSLDWDIATDARPTDVQRIFRRTVPVGVQFGTVGVLDRQGVLHEVTTFRRDVRTDGRHAEVEFGASLDDDLARRDFTINAIAVHPETLAVRDPFDGRADLRARVIRAVGDPDARMTEDRLRALRGIRFASRFDFAIDPATWRAIVASGPHLGRLSIERVKQELDKVMEQCARPSTALQRYRDAGVFTTLVPALAAVPDDALAVVDRLPPGGGGRRVARHTALALALHAGEVAAVLKALRFSTADTQWIVHLAQSWHALSPAISAAWGAGAVDDATLRRWASVVGRTRVRAFARLVAARLARTPSANVAPFGRVHRRALRLAWRSPIELADLAVDGEDLARVGVAKGPALGAMLKALLDVVIDDPTMNTVERLMAEAARRVAAS